MDGEIIVGGLALSAVIVAVIQAAKRAGLDPRWAGLVAIALGIASAVALYAQGAVEGPVTVAVLLGAYAGAGAAGLYSATDAARGN